MIEKMELGEFYKELRLAESSSSQMWLVLD
ncbi:Uncharacterised protein [Streptococcus pneumoniae]|nr:Uncharacterised protein [Streptococcus pneumoniae]